MRRERVKITLLWFLMFCLCIFAISERPISNALNLPAVDCFFVLACFAMFYFSKLELFSVLIISGFLKDLLFGVVLGPAILSLLFCLLLTPLIKGLLRGETLWKGLIYVEVSNLLAHFWQALIFTILPFKTAGIFTFGQRLILAIQRSGQQFIRLPLFFIFFYLVFFLFYPGFKNRTEQGSSDKLSINLEEVTE